MAFAILAKVALRASLLRISKPCREQIYGFRVSEKVIATFGNHPHLHIVLISNYDMCVSTSSKDEFLT